MLWFAIPLLLLLAGCATPPPPVAKPAPDLTKESWYDPAVRQLAAMDRDAAKLLESGQPDQAAALITSAQPLAARLLAAVHPTLPAMEAASDLDQLYGRMLLSNRHYGWARLTFQKNMMRWKNWRPQTAESLRRFAEAQAEVAECDRRLEQPTP